MPEPDLQVFELCSIDLIRVDFHTNNFSNLGVSCGVDIISISFIPESIKVDKDSISLVYQILVKVV